MALRTMSRFSSIVGSMSIAASITGGGLGGGRRAAAA
jgi:hypothetical protein